MITVSDECASVLAGSGFTYQMNVEAWLGGTLLAPSVPLAVAGEECDRSLNVPERMVFTAPREVAGVDWTPSSPAAPLAAKGQRLHVKLGVGLSQGRTEWLTRGRFLVYESEDEGDAVQGSAVGLLQLVQEARLISPFQPTGTFISTIRSLVEPALTVLFDASLVDRAVPAALNYDEDRLGALGEILDAWPAMAVVDPSGYLQVLPTTQSLTPVRTFVDGIGGTAIRVTGSSSRDQGENAIVARGTAADGSQVQSAAYITTGPNAVGGPYNPLPVPYFFQSPLLTGVDQCQKAAITIRDRRARQTAQPFKVSAVPDPRLQLGDVVGLTSDRYGLVNTPASVEWMSLPYAADAGQLPDMALVCRVLT